MMVQGSSLPPLLLIIVCMLSLFATLAHSQTTAAFVQTPYGTLQGFTTPIGSQFLGVPYAQPPIGNLRWKNPQPPLKWNGIYNATRFIAGCAQNCGEPPGACPATISEDCLHLNIYVPIQSENASSPVYVFFHGGNYKDSSPMALLYSSQFLANVTGSVVVIVGYRLGALGFLTLDELDFSGWYGMYDQWAALEWIQDNIGYFGGNRSQVTIGGQSAGAISNHDGVVGGLVDTSGFHT
eukprot:TRINITY_DN3533_c0_g1_i2.p1 TRINITY_DN3533_c0_g1~~TRINITY_DN3533_c0_g1_i2.p1  ORF type:complete len:238 (+),score=42.08 TRINITY_DN3533_c0_g1_i2:269-982(+)